MKRDLVESVGVLALETDRRDSGPRSMIAALREDVGAWNEERAALKDAVEKNPDNRPVID